MRWLWKIGDITFIPLSFSHCFSLSLSFIILFISTGMVIFTGPSVAAALALQYTAGWLYQQAGTDKEVVYGWSGVLAQRQSLHTSAAIMIELQLGSTAPPVAAHLKCRHSFELWHNMIDLLVTLYLFWGITGKHVTSASLTG